MYIYALLKTPAAPLKLPQGIAGTLQIAGTAHLAALVEAELLAEDMSQDHDLLMQAVTTHDQVIRDLFQQTTILPLPFFRTFFSPQGLIQHLTAHEQMYLEKLSQLEGKAEYLLKFISRLPEPFTPPTGKGKDYFLAKKQQYQAQIEQQTQKQQELERAVIAIGKIYPDHLVGDPQADPMRIYLLVDRGDDHALHQVVQNLQQSCIHWDLVLGEQLPPYHFVNHQLVNHQQPFKA